MTGLSQNKELIISYKYHGFNIYSRGEELKKIELNMQVSGVWSYLYTLPEN